MESGAIATTNGARLVSGDLGRRYDQVRELSRALAEPLSDADASLQSMEDASPAKWHLAHTSWFFETFLLREHAPGYCRFDERWPFLFNSYYEGEGARIPRSGRGMLSRPSLAQVLDYREHVDAAIGPLLDDSACAALIELGLAHEQQHQELLLTDIKHALFQNPLGPAMFAPSPLLSAVAQHPTRPAAPEWRAYPGGLVEIGAAGEGFAFDCEGPRHRVHLEPFALASRLVTNREWDAFIEAGGYRSAGWWLSDGWSWVEREQVAAPLYWRGEEVFTHAGWQRREPEAPVAHISYYEADAFARWAGARLPTEAEWEAMAQAEDPASGHQLDKAGPPQPRGDGSLFGDVWQWTGSAYLPYPRFRPAAGAVGEYNGKFMSGQFVLRGASCATPRGHARASYRNFFYPHQRWQFTGLRLARDA